LKQLHAEMSSVNQLTFLAGTWKFLEYLNKILIMETESNLSWSVIYDTKISYVVQEALLVRQCKERRIAFSEGSTYKPPVSSICKHVGDACSAPAVPLAKYCLQRILFFNLQEFAKVF